MKKWSMALVLLFCGMCLFAQSLFDVVTTGTPEQVQAAIKAGARIDDRDNWFSDTPLMWAAFLNENPDVIMALLNAGAKLDDRDRVGRTPLMWAAFLNKNPDVIATLLNAGADGTIKSSEGKTAFDYAQQNQKLEGTKAYWDLNNARF